MLRSNITKPLEPMGSSMNSRHYASIKN